MSRDILGSVGPRELGSVRRQVHWASQLIAEAGETHGEALADTSHTAMVYRADLEGFVGSVPLADTLHVGLSIPSLTLLVLQGTAPVDRLPLLGTTLPEARAFLGQALAARSGGRLGGPLTHPGYELEAPAFGDDERFAAAPEGLGEVAAWFAHADRALARFHSERDSESLCWPHHFDIARLRTIATDSAGAATQTVGLGLSPGDGAIPEPYWYVNHWPARDPSEVTFGELPGGHWQTEGFVAAVLTGTDIVARDTAESQREIVDLFLENAVRQSEELLA